jgi:hypothetical protein
MAPANLRLALLTILASAMPSEPAAFLSRKVGIADAPASLKIGAPDAPASLTSDLSDNRLQEFTWEPTIK